MDNPASSSHCMSDSPYTPLNRGFQEIRLLELEPSNFDDNLVITLRTRRLAKKRPHYDALSYYWGKENCPHKATVNGKSITIGVFLDCALRHIRNKANQTRMLWVDALCINQGDVDERNCQVQLMKDIYSSAQKVLIWLGPERAGDEYVLKCIRSGDLPESEEDGTRLLRIVKRICRRPWIGRVWVAQELALAREDPVVYLGARTLYWSQLHEYVKQLKDRTDLETAAGHSLWCSFGDAAYRVLHLGLIKEQRIAGFSTLGWWSAASLATDLRDKVYGLLSLCTFFDGQTTLVPNYSKTAQRVFSEATYSMLQDKNGNFPYTMFPLNPPHISNKPPIYQAFPGLPSWALDLNISSQTLGSYRENYPYRFVPPSSVNKRGPDLVLVDEHNIPECVKISDNFKQLSTCGVHLGTITKTSGSALADRLPSSSVFAAALYDIYNNILKPQSITEDTFLQALTVNRRADVEDTESFNEILDYQMEIELYSPHWNVLHDLIRSNASIIFVTEGNRVGLTYHCDFENGIRPGDVVVGLFGANFPFILRAVTGGLNGSTVYTMVNVAYLADHKYGHDFLSDVNTKANWGNFAKHGLKEYKIV